MLVYHIAHVLVLEVEHTGISSNRFEILAAAEDPEVEVTDGNNQRNSKQLVPRPSNDQGGQDSIGLDANLDVRRKDSKNNLSAEPIGLQAHSSNAPTLHFSNPQVEQIIKNVQNEMMMKNTMSKQPLVTLNTSVYDIPSQSCESIGEHWDESGQPSMSTGNNNQIIQAKEREMAIKSKLWDDQREEDDEEYLGDGFAGYSSEEADHDNGKESAGEELESLALSKPIGAPATSHKSKLNVNAPVFLPNNSPKKTSSRTAATQTPHTGPAANDRTDAAIEQQQQAALSTFGQQQQNTTNSEVLFRSNMMQQRGRNRKAARSRSL